MRAADDALDAALEAGGEAGRLVRAFDWSGTSLGPMASWSPLLRGMVAMCVLSPFPMDIGWGPDLILVHNDAAGRLLAGMHPAPLGQPKQVVLADLWDTAGPLHRAVLERGEPAWRENARYVLSRRGFPEERYLTFSHSPIVGEEGVTGVLTVMSETTRSVVVERRLRTLSALGNGSAAGAAVGAGVGVGAGAGRTFAAALDILEANRFDVPFALVYLVESDGRRARLAGRTGLRPGRPLVPEHAGLRSRRPWPLGRAIAQARTVVVSLDPVALAGVGDWADGLAPAAALVVPLRDRSLGEPAGAAVLGVNPALPLDDAQRGFLELVARQLALVVGDARADEAELARADLLADPAGPPAAQRRRVESRARDAERRRVARELHDSVLQTLYGIALGAESIRSLVRTDVERVPPVAEYVVNLARSALEEMRALILELRPETLEQDGLVASLRGLAAPMASRHGLRVALDLGQEPAASLEVKEALFRIAQEALHNVARHARAAEVRLALATETEEAVVLRVEDDGVGFDAEAEFAGHLGQKTMRERAELVGGTLVVASAPGRGTAVTARVPGAP